VFLSVIHSSSFDWLMRNHLIVSAILLLPLLTAVVFGVATFRTGLRVFFPGGRTLRLR
jgi:hypothetical protein